MIEIVIKLFGMCLTLLPIVFYVHYLLAHVNSKQKFDLHLEIAKDIKGGLGVFIAYLTKISFGCMICFLGVYLSTYFESELFLYYFLISLLIYLISKFFDKKNEI